VFIVYGTSSSTLFADLKYWELMILESHFLFGWFYLQNVFSTSEGYGKIVSFDIPGNWVLIFRLSFLCYEYFAPLIGCNISLFKYCLNFSLGGIGSCSSKRFSRNYLILTVRLLPLYIFLETSLSAYWLLDKSFVSCTTFLFLKTLTDFD